jgi:hypothetical protein
MAAQLSRELGIRVNRKQKKVSESTVNLHERKTAKNCYAYLERARRVVDNENIPVETIEFKWAGYLLPNVVIGPKQSRRFDAFWVFHDAPASAF